MSLALPFYGRVYDLIYRMSKTDVLDEPLPEGRRDRLALLLVLTHQSLGAILLVDFISKAADLPPAAKPWLFLAVFIPVGVLDLVALPSKPPRKLDRPFDVTVGVIFAITFIALALGVSVTH
jgi:hypothetical protein